MNKVVVAFVIGFACAGLVVWGALRSAGHGKAKIDAVVLSSAMSPTGDYGASLIEIDHGKKWNVVVYQAGTDPKTLAVSDSVAFPNGVDMKPTYRWVERAIVMIEGVSKEAIDDAAANIGPIRLAYR